MYSETPPAKSGLVACVVGGFAHCIIDTEIDDWKALSNSVTFQGGAAKRDLGQVYNHPDRRCSTPHNSWTWTGGMYGFGGILIQSLPNVSACKSPSSLLDEPLCSKAE